jgi:hypothetical protein
MEPERPLTGGWLVLAALRFAAEIGMLAALGYVGWRLGGDSQAVAIVLAVVLVSLAATVWGLWVAPRAARRLEDPGRLFVELALFGVAVLGLVVLAEGSGTVVVAAAVLALAYAVSAPVGRRGY